MLVRRMLVRKNQAFIGYSGGGVKEASRSKGNGAVLGAWQSKFAVSRRFDVLGSHFDRKHSFEGLGGRMPAGGYLFHGQRPVRALTAQKQAPMVSPTA